MEVNYRIFILKKFQYKKKYDQKNKRESNFIIHFFKLAIQRLNLSKEILQIKESYNLPLAQIIIQDSKIEMIAQNQQWIKQGYFVDAKDKNGDWQAGLIMGITKTQIKIRFDGWASRNDQIFPLLTQRLKPFRSITRGYTGPYKSQPTRQHWKFSLNDNQSRLLRLEQFFNEISQKSAFEINQYLRGQNYFYINHLLTLTYNTIEQFSSVYQYFKMNIKFITKYLLEIIQRQTTIWFSHHHQQSNNNNNSNNSNNFIDNNINIDTKLAYSQCYYQLFEIIYMIINGKNQTFLRTNQKYLKQIYSKQYQQSQQLNQDITFQQLITKQLLKTQFLSTYEKFITKLFDQTFTGVKNIPLQFLLSTVMLLSGLERLPFSKQLKKKLYLNLLYVIKQHLSAIQLTDVKIHQRTIQDILGWMRYLATRLIVLEKQEIYKWTQQSKLKLWTMMIQCDVLEKKLRGITKIKQFYQLIIQKLSNPIENSSVTTSRQQFRIWLINCNLIKMIFELNQHTQVIKKGCQMFLLFYCSKYKLITINQLVYIWSTCFNKHQAIKKVVFQFWLQLAQHISQQQDWSKFIGVLVQNDNKIDQKEDWQMQAMFSLIKSLQCDQQLQQFNQLIKMIYIKTMNNPKFIPQLAKRLSFLQKDNQILKNIIDDCLQSIQQRNEHVFHLKLLSRIFAQLRTQKFYIPSNLVPILISQLEIFLQTNQQNEKLILSIFHIFNQIMSIKQQEITPKLQLQTSLNKDNIRSIQNNKSVQNNKTTTKISLQHFEKLWQMFSRVQNYQIKRIFYSWIVFKSFNSMYNFYVYTINPRFSIQFRHQIFFKFLCNSNKLQLNKLDLNQFIVFRQFFIYINYKYGSIQVRQLDIDDSSSVQKKIIRVRNNQLKGMQYLWEIFKYCPQYNEEVVNSVCSFICDLYLRTSHSMSKEQKSNRVNQLMQRLQEFIMPTYNNNQLQLQLQIQSQQQQQHISQQQHINPTLIRKSLTLTQKLLSDIQQKIQIPKQFQRLQKIDKLSITTYITLNDQKSLQIYTQQPFILIKQKIAKIWNLQNQQFTLINGKSQVVRQMYQLPYYLHSFEQKYFRIVRLPNDTINTITTFIYQKLYYEIITYLKQQQLSLQSFNVLQMLDIHHPLKLFHLLQSQISTVSQIQKCKKRIYLHIYFLRVIDILLMNQNIVWGQELVKKLVQHLDIKIENNLIVNYLQKLIEILTALRKKCKDDVRRLQLIKHQQQMQRRKRQGQRWEHMMSISTKQQQLAQVPTTITQLSSSINTTANTILTLLTSNPHTTTLLLNLINYINNNPNTNNTHQNRLFNLTIIFYTNSFPNNKTLFNQFIKDNNFKQLMQQIFVQCEFLPIKKGLQRRIGAWIKDGFVDLETQKQFAQFFINQLYYKIYQKSLIKKLKIQYISLFSLFRTILQTISTQAFQYIITTQFQQIIYPTNNNNITQQQLYPNQLTLPFYLIQSFKQQYDSPMQSNYLLNGQLQVLIGLIKRQRRIVTRQFVQYLLYQCLIYLPGATRGIDVKCLAKENVILVIELLQMIMIDIHKITQPQTNPNTKPTTLLTLNPTQFTTTILMNLQQFHILQYWRSSKQWNIEYEQISKTRYEFVGLQNPGCICYINSLLQQLFMIEQFRWAVLGVQGNKVNYQEKMIDSNKNNNTQQNNNSQQQKPINSPQLIPKLKTLFLQLLFSQSSSIDPIFFTSSLKTTNDRPLVKIFQQMDIDEFSMILFDKIQNHLHHLRQKNFIRDLFGGTYSNEILSLQCKHSSQRQQQFLSISLDVKKHITQSFMSLVKGQILQGQNAYYCQHCDRKVKAMKRLSIKRLPPHLIISLRRFQFDYEIDQKIKINKYCQFPLQLNLENYSQQKLNQTVASGGNNKSSNNTIINETQRSSSRLFSQVQLQQPQHQQQQQQQQQQQNQNNIKDNKNYFNYKLKGVVIHSGSADSGHYYSFIENKDGRWFQFNDQKVAQFDVNSLQQEAFGARDGQYVKIKNAYLLFYERVQSKMDDNKCGNKTQSKERFMNSMVSQQLLSYENIVSNNNLPSVVADRQLSQPLITSTTQPQPSTPYNLPQSILTQSNTSIIQQIIIQNKRIRQYHLFFSQQYLQFVTNTVQYFLTMCDKENQQILIDLLSQTAKQIRLVCLDNVDKDIMRNNKQILLEDRQLMKGLFHYLLGFTFCMQLRQKNQFITIWLLDSINLLFFEHEISQTRIQFIQLFLSSVIKQQFIDEFIIQCTKQKSRIIVNFIINVLTKYLKEKKVNIEKKDYHVKKLFKLIMKNITIANTNISELILIMRKVLFISRGGEKQQHGIIKFYQLIQWIFKRQFITILIQNILSNNIDKQTLQNITKIIDNDYKMQLQHIETLLERNNQRYLFGIYQQKTKSYTKSSQKQTFTLLAQLWQQIKHEKELLQQQYQFLRDINVTQGVQRLYENNKDQFVRQSQGTNPRSSSVGESQKSSNITESIQSSNISSRTQTNPISPQSITVSNIHTPHHVQSHNESQRQSQSQSQTIMNQRIQIEDNPIQSSIRSNINQQHLINDNEEKDKIVNKYIWLNYIICKLQASILPIKPQKLIKIISQQKDTKSAVALASFIAEFIQDNQKYNDLTLVALQNGLKDYESSKYRPIFICIEKLLQIQDTLTQKRRQQIFRVLRAALRHNEKYFNQCDFTHQWMLRYASRFDFFQSILRENPSFINEIRSWIVQKRYPGQQTIKKHRQPNCDRLPFRHHGIMVSGEIKDYEILSNNKYDWFEKIKTNEFTPQINYRELNSLDEKYNKDDIVECYCDNGFWLQGTVEGSYYGIIYVVFAKKNGKPQQMLYFDEDQKLRIKNPKITTTSENSKMEIQK